MLNRGTLFLKKLNESRGKIVKLALQFITNGAVSYKTSVLNTITVLVFDF